MLTRATALALLIALTLSLAWSPTTFISVFPFLAPVLVLLVGGRFRIGPIPLSFVALALLAAVSAVVTAASLGYALLWVALVPLFLVARHRLPDVLSPRALARALALVISAVGLLVLYQVTQQTTFGSPYSFVATEMRLGLTTNAGTFVQRPVGVFHNSNILGQWIVYASLLLLPILRTLPRKWRLAVVGVLVVPLALTYSRAVWAISIIVATILLLRWINRSELRVAISSILMATLGLAVVFLGAPTLPTNALPDRFGVDDTQQNLELRRGLNDYGLSVAAEHPVVGVGYLQFPSSLGGDGSLRPHNVFVQVAAEQGIPTAAVLGLVVLIMTVTCWQRAREVLRVDPLLSGALAALPLAWTGFMLVYSSAADYAVMPLFVTAAGYLLAQADRKHDDSPIRVGGRMRASTLPG